MKPIRSAHQGISSCLLAVLLAAAGPARAQSIVREWARVFDSGGIDQSSEIDVTPAGDVYVVGTASAQDTTSLLLVHYSSDGSLRFSTQLGTAIDSWWASPLLAVDRDARAVVSADDGHLDWAPRGRHRTA